MEIHIFVPIICFIFLAVLCKKKAVLKFIFELCFIFFFITLCLFYFKKDDVVSKVPFVTIDKSREISIDNTGIMLVSSDYSYKIKNEYILSDDINEEDLKSWLNKSKKNIVIYIKDANDDIIWDYDLGLADLDSFKRITKIYNDWLDNGVVPKDRIRYKFLCFYFDV